ncbi:DUF3048 domain-containing protein [Demequina sp.]|uniref:DUF3048 domain-containing protein n=1 Tax=Demequina sp. TaxID=2050685 RepID=UPI0025D14458|nr:DUF3048 domain-containing protein [Demequina sp.]
MMTTRIGGALAAAAVLLLAACAPATTDGGPQSTVSVAAPSPSATAPSLPPAPEDPRPEMTWPLTGLDSSGISAAKQDRPALAIKIENSAAARPQENLDKADVVFEEYVEGGISRLVAVFHSNFPESVGPIRSMRPMDKNIMGSFGGPLVFSGAQGRFISAARDSGQLLLAQDVGSYGFYRSSARSAPHNLYGYPAKFQEQASKLSAPREQWAFAYPDETATAQATGKPVSKIDIDMSRYSDPGWRWSASEGVWLRIEAGSPHVTSAGTQLSATNVVILSVTVQYTSNKGGSSVPETIINGQSGDGFLVSGDSMVPIRWSKAGQYKNWELTTTGGDPVSLIPGQTWFELVPNKGVGHSTSIDIS